MCQNPQCGGNHAYQCRQIRSKMLVGYTEGGNVVNLRNNTINIGCSCVRRSSNTVVSFSPFNKKEALLELSNVVRQILKKSQMILWIIQIVSPTIVIPKS